MSVRQDGPVLDGALPACEHECHGSGEQQDAGGDAREHQVGAGERQVAAGGTRSTGVRDTGARAGAGAVPAPEPLPGRPVPGVPGSVGSPVPGSGSTAASTGIVTARVTVCPFGRVRTSGSSVVAVGAARAATRAAVVGAVGSVFASGAPAR